MTTPPRLLADRVGTGPILIQRKDFTEYAENDPSAVLLLIRAECVEGVGPRSGRIAFLRMTCTETEALERIRVIAAPVEEKPGSITSMASREVFREKLGDSGFWAWTHKMNRNLSGMTA